MSARKYCEIRIAQEVFTKADAKPTPGGFLHRIGGAFA
jgi:hypothetical protein